MIQSLHRNVIIGIFIFLASLMAGWLSPSLAADLLLSWMDNSNNESGFFIVRKTGTNGTYSHIVSVGTNITSFVDTGLSTAATYCYMVRAYNSAGNSSFTPQVCAQPSSAPSFNFSLAHGGNKSVAPGQSVSNVITANLVSGSSQTVSFSTSGLPSGTSASFATSSSCSPTCSRTLTLTTSSSTPTGTHPITVKGSAGGITKTTMFDLTVTAGASGNTTSGTTVIREGESGILTAPMVSRSDSAASGGKYVEVPVGTGNNYDDGSFGGPGEVRFPISIPQSGTYALWARTIAPSGWSDSFYVTRNGSLLSEWFVPHSTSWMWNKVTNVALGTGTVNLAFRQREDGTKLDQIILTDDLVYIPSGIPQSSPPSTSLTLTVNVVKQLTSNGTGNGSVTSSPSGINCGSDCSESYNSGTVVNLTAHPATGSTFAGWGGNADCNDGIVTMSSDISCSATFSAQGSALTVSKSGNGTGTVTSSPSGINCGTDCSESYASGTSVTLTAFASAGSAFNGWSGGGCGQSTNCTLTISGSTTVTANFNTATNGTGADKIGVYSPATGQFFLDRNGNGRWDGCSVDLCFNWLAQNNGIPVAGDWDGSGTIRIGTFDSASANWYLDRNGNGRWDGCSVDICSSSVGLPGDYPVVRYNKNSKRHNIGIFRSAVYSNNTLVNRGVWNIDVNGNYVFDGAVVDDYVSHFGWQNNLPVVGDWNGNNTAGLGIFDPIYSFWMLDTNSNDVWDGCNLDICYSPFGQSNDLPVVGDWDDSGYAKIGVFRPGSGQWFLDKNGDGQLQSCSVDICMNFFSQAGYLPVVGKW